MEMSLDSRLAQIEWTKREVEKMNKPKCNCDLYRGLGIHAVECNVNKGKKVK